MNLLKYRLACVLVIAALLAMFATAASAQDKGQASEDRPSPLVQGPLGIPMPQQQRAEAARILQDELVELLDLRLKAKQLHWTVVGPRFRPLHMQLDEIAEIADEAADMVAERMLALGAAPDGRAETVAKQSSLEAVPAGLVKNGQVVDLTVKLLEAKSKRLHEHIRELDEVDLVTQDILIEAAQGVDKQLWMIQAQQY